MKRVALLFGLAVLVAGCNKGGFSQRTSVEKSNIFVYPIGNKPTTLDPGKVEDGDTIDVIQQAYEGLVGWSEKNVPSPRLATSWDIKDGGATYVFHLRKGVKFHNGRGMTAQDFKWCIERNCNPAFTSATASTYLSDIVGVKERLAKKAPEVSGVKALDDNTLEIKIDKPRPYFLGKLTYPVAFVFAKEALKDPLKEITDVSEMIGTGGFKFEKAVPDQEITFTAFKDYYEGAPKIDGIRRPYVGDSSTRLQMYKNNQIDLVQLERQDLEALKTDAAYKDDLKYFDRPALWYIGLHSNSPQIVAFKDPRVRRAFAMAIDKDKIVKEQLGGINTKADSIVPPGVFGHREKVNGVAFNPEGARKLLAEAGFPGGKGLPDLEINFRNNHPDIERVAEAVGTQLKRVLGVNVSMQPLEWGAYLEKHDKHQLPFFHMRWAADYLDAQNFLSTLLATGAEENRIDYHNPQFDALCAKADVSLDPAERLKLYAQAEDIALQDAPFIPLFFQKDIELIRPRVVGIRESVFGHLPHTKVSLR